jgi:hypothetical protein
MFFLQSKFHVKLSFVLYLIFQIEHIYKIYLYAEILILNNYSKFFEGNYILKF